MMFENGHQQTNDVSNIVEMIICLGLCFSIEGPTLTQNAQCKVFVDTKKKVSK